MEVSRDRAPAGPIVTGLSPRGFRIGESVLPAVLMTAAEAMPWSPPPLAELDTAALGPILAPAPEFMLIGTGATLSQPPRALVRALEERGIGIEAMDSRAAARAWGVLRAEGRIVAAALYPLLCRHPREMTMGGQAAVTTARFVPG